MHRPPDPATDPPLWRWMGSVLPRRIREGVYEPCYLDLRRSIARAGPARRCRTLLGWLTVVGYLLAAIGYAIPEYCRARDRAPLARWAIRAAAVGGVMAATLLLVARYRYY